MLILSEKDGKAVAGSRLTRVCGMIASIRATRTVGGFQTGQDVVELVEESVSTATCTLAGDVWRVDGARG